MRFVCVVLCVRACLLDRATLNARAVCVSSVLGEWRHLRCPREESGSRATVGAYNAERAGGGLVGVL